MKDKNYLEIRNIVINNFRTKIEFYELFFFVFKIEKKNFVNHENSFPNKKDLFKFINLLVKYETTPIQYLKGNAFFYKTLFFVNKNVLIPRSETELIVDEIVNDKESYLSYADICTGSSCIALSVSKEKKFDIVYATDISNKALKVAKINCNKYENIIIKKSNLFSYFLKNKIKVNLLTMNPPYIEKNDKNLDKMVFDNEPHLALFAKKDGLYFYEQLFLNLENVIDTKNKFKIFCEFGFNQKKMIEDLYKSFNFKYEIIFKRDLNNNWRYFIINN